MTLNDFYNEISRRTDTAGTKINAAETRRVLSEGFALLATLSTAESAGIIAKGLAAGEKKAAGKKAPKKKSPKKKAKR